MELLRNNPYLLAAGALAVLNTILLAWLFWQFWGYRKKQQALWAGEEVKNIEDLLLKHKQTLSNHAKNLKELGKILAELVENNKFNIQKVGVVRFNPFADTGGNMSFVVALLDGEGDGIVISSLHSREGTRIYAKPVEKGKSSYNLTQEETDAIARANLKSQKPKSK